MLASHDDGQADKVHPHHVHAASLMTECANRFLAALDANQRGKATFPFDTDERMNWHFIPKERRGLPLREMMPYQKHLASALLASGLSQTGYIKALTIMSLEDVLRIIESDNGERRNPEKYYFSVFGIPSDSGTWGYRVEGHHLSQNFTVVNGKVIDGPSFYGANPAEVRQGPRKGLRTLVGEDDLGIDIGNHLAQQIFAGDAEMDGTLREQLGDLGGRKIGDFDARQVRDSAAIVARAARLDERETGTREERFGVFLQPSFGRHGDDEGGAHAPLPQTARRSIQTAKPTAGIGAGLPIRVSRPS